MRNPQPYSPTKESAARRAALLQGAGRLPPRALDRITVASAVRQTYSAGSAYDTVDYDSLDEDTIEMVLSPEDMQLLSRAAEEALAGIRAGRVAAAAPNAAPTPVEAPIAAKGPTASEICALEMSAGAPSAPPSPPVATAPSITPTPSAAKAPAVATTPLIAATAVVSTMASATPAPLTTTARPAPTHPSRAAVTSPPPSRVSRWSPVRMLGMIGAIAVAAVALASMAHHATPAAAPGSMQPSTPAPAPAPATQLAAPMLAAVAPIAAVSSTLVLSPVPTASSVATPGPVASGPDASDPSAPAPVRIKNPFDHSEVFEFPAGTSSEAAHQSVADILLQRAHERGIQPLHPARANHAH